MGLPAHNGQQRSQRQYQQQQLQQNGGVFQPQPSSVQQNHHKQQQHPLQTHQPVPYFPSQPGHHRNTQNASPAQGGDPKDKDKNCVIQGSCNTNTRNLHTKSSPKYNKISQATKPHYHS